MKNAIPATLAALALTGCGSFIPAPPPSPITDVARQLNTALARADEPAAAAAVEKITELARLPDPITAPRLTIPDPLETAAAVATGAATVWPPAALIAAAIAAVQTYRRRKSEQEAEGGAVIARAIEYSPDELKRQIKTLVLRRQIAQGKQDAVTAVLTRANV